MPYLWQVSARLLLIPSIPLKHGYRLHIWQLTPSRFIGVGLFFPWGFIVLDFVITPSFYFFLFVLFQWVIFICSICDRLLNVWHQIPCVYSSAWHTSTSSPRGGSSSFTLIQPASLNFLSLSCVIDLPRLLLF